jgi:hypothetical protein
MPNDFISYTNGLGKTQFAKYGSAMEAAGVLHSQVYAPGNPGVGNPPATGLNGAALTAFAGAVPFVNPVAGQKKHLVGLGCRANQIGAMALYERLWHNSGIVVTTLTEQALASAAFPARDLDGASNGRGIVIGIQVTSATTNGATIANMSLRYTSSTGAANRSATLPSFPATAVAGTTMLFPWASGDFGVQSIQGITLGTSLVAGTVNLVAYRPLASVGVLIPGAKSFADLSETGFVRLYNDSVLEPLWYAANTSGVNLDADIIMWEGL